MENEMNRLYLFYVYSNYDIPCNNLTIDDLNTNDIIAFFSIGLVSSICLLSLCFRNKKEKVHYKVVNSDLYDSEQISKV